MCKHLEAVSEGRIQFLLMTVPPGMMKSLLMVFWTAWEWGPCARPDIQVLATSYSQPNVLRDNIKLRRIVESPKFQMLWPMRLRADQNAKGKFENTGNGFSEARPFSSMTGGRGDRVKIDDPHSTETAESDTERATAVRIFREGISDRLNDVATSAIVIIMQRLHAQDVAAVALELDIGCVHLNLPMEFEPESRCRTYVDGELFFEDPRTTDGELLFPERFPASDVERLKKAKGSYAYAGQYQQRPAPRDGGLFKRSDFKTITQPPALIQYVRGWDFAAGEDLTAARTAGVKIGIARDGRVIVAHMVVERASPAGERNLVKTTAQADGIETRISLPQDPGQAGKDQAQQMVKMLVGYTVRASRETGDKITRADPFAAQVEAGNVYLVEGPWNEAFLDEMEVFPSGKLKDIVDAASRAFSECALGAGRVFEPDMAELESKPMALPSHWPKAFALAADATSVVALWGAWDEFGACHIYAETELSRGDHANLGAAVKARGDWVRGVLSQTAQMNQSELKEYKAALRRHNVYARPDDMSPDAGVTEVKSMLAKGFVKIFSNLDRLEDAYRTYYKDDSGQPAEPSLYMDAMRALVASGRKRAQIKPNSFNTSSGRGPTTLSGF